jgi:DNA-directed RNA polymerase subunit beta'
MASRNQSFNLNDFDSMAIKLASPEVIKSWSFGEVTKPETINYRTQRSERNGLFDEKIFGPDKDYECYCGKYRGVRYKGIVCEKCGVEITRSIVRRERMGHIELATPVSHIWFLRSVPSRIGMILGIPASSLEKVIYFAGYIITNIFEDERQRALKELDNEFKSRLKAASTKQDKENLKELLTKTKSEIEELELGQVLDEVQYHNYSVKYSTLFEAGIGAEAIYKILKGLDLAKLKDNLEKDLEEASSVEKERINKRISLVRSMNQANLRPEWMFLTRIPVIPPALRPMVPLDGGRYATSDVNDLYRRVINRNNRLKKLKEINAPEVILRNEKRILQEAVDSLIDNTLRQGSAQATPLSQAQKRALKSLADNLKGKRGFFRQNLLGKRVDYSGRSVIVVGPSLSLDQCGLPKHMALELFRPFVISQILKKELAYNIKGASRLIEEGVPEVWAILEEVIEGKRVLLNRAPTLHRLGIQAFRPILIEGNAIQIHPLVCAAFNADFDGDQMAVHVPLSEEAQLEAREIMAANKNILKPGSGDSIVSAKMLDIILGCFWMTKILPGEKGEGKYFASPNSAITAFDFGEVSFRARVKILSTSTQKYQEFEEGIFETSVGRLLFNSVLPNDYPFINSEIERKRMAALIEDLIERYGIENVPPVMDKIKALGFKYATYAGITWGIDEVKEPAEKNDLITSAYKKIEEVTKQYNDGLISTQEKLRRSIEIWHWAKSEIEKAIPQSLDKRGSVYDMVSSGARGSLSQITQMVGMKGLIQNPSGDIIEFPVLSSIKEGLTPIEYFITTHGSRKGLTDTALNTAKAGYLTRRLFDVAQDSIVTEEDCGTKEGIVIKKEDAVTIPLWRHIKGRFLSEDVLDEKSKTVFSKGHFVTKKDALLIEESSSTEVTVRSPLSCKSLRGICALCYGADLGNNKPVSVGEAVGTVAAQAIGEPGTQLTMRTFHAGGTASLGGDITTGLLRVEEVFEKRQPKNPAAVSHIDGMVLDIKEEKGERMIILTAEGKVSKSKKETEYPVSPLRSILVKKGDAVTKGQVLTDGSVDLNELFKYGGKEATESYIIRDISHLYELQGEPVSRKHIEVIVRQMFGRRKVKDPGGTSFSIGDVVEEAELGEENLKAKEAGKDEAKAEKAIMGVTEVSLTRKSFLSAASFQHTTRVLISASVRGRDDKLAGLKENVIIGRLIPAGSNFPSSWKTELIEKVKKAKEIGEER